jgi:hypothetical protein
MKMTQASIERASDLLPSIQQMHCQHKARRRLCYSNNRKNSEHSSLSSDENQIQITWTFKCAFVLVTPFSLGLMAAWLKSGDTCFLD